MKILVIDTACNLARVALTEDGVLRKEITVDDKRRHSVKLLPAIETLLADCGIAAKELDLIGVTKGPGSFTGLRIGVVTAKTMAYALRIPLVGVNTLDAIAASFSQVDEIICPLIDARNTRAYGAFYRGKERIGARFVRPVRDTLEAFLSEFENETMLACGDGTLNPTIVEILMQGLGARCRIVDAADHPGKMEDLANLAFSIYRDAPDKSVFDCNAIDIDYMKDWG
ncbi:MAG: tRNA (adenosine(37)-N6)-threonylcarbamoyltransferase complex dimerization subunit type 1 TsaB [Clostridia bacterium]|nr:tRNA (adenosine(37)-N6)-threonylcarbamoyltransferase complex dimerization subunit type 1 TsaB [Clostridia bacterium]